MSSLHGALAAIPFHLEGGDRGCDASLNKPTGLYINPVVFGKPDCTEAELFGAREVAGSRFNGLKK